MTAEELTTKRKAAGLTQQQLAEAAGWEGANAKQRIYDLESGRRPIKPTIAKLLGLIFSDSVSTP